MADYGVDRRVYRDKVPMQVLRGFYPTEPSKLSLSLAPIDAEAIKSGMVIKRSTGTVGGVASQPGFAKAVSTDTDAPAVGAPAVQIFLALHDQDSHDVQAAGVLVGLDCSDDYEVQTGYFNAASTYAIGDPLSVSATDGSVDLAGNGDVIIGYITAVGGNANGSIPYVGKTPSTAVANSDVIQFKTALTGALLRAV